MGKKISNRQLAMPNIKPVENYGLCVKLIEPFNTGLNIHIFWLAVFLLLLKHVPVCL